MLNKKSGYKNGHNRQPEKVTLSKTDLRYWQKRLFKHTRKVDGQIYTDADYSVRIAHQNRRESFQLDTPNQYAAAQKAREIHQYLCANGWEQTLPKFKPAKASAAPKSNLSIGDFLRALLTQHPSKIRTIGAYAGSIRRIAAEIAGLPSGGRGGKPNRHELWRARVEAIKLTVLCPASKIHRWKESFLARAGQDPLAQRSARVSCNTFIREARSLFGKNMLEGLEDVVLPNPLPFAGVKLEKRSSQRYQSTFDVMTLVKDACEELAFQYPERFKMFVLAVVVGLRRGEIDKLEWPAFNWATGTLNIAPTKYFRGKTEDSIRSIWIPPQMLEIFRGYRAQAQGVFVVESTVAPIMGLPYEHYRCGTAFEHLITWLRAKGVSAQKPIHTLRKEFGSLIAAQFGIYAAKELLGHADIATTASYYLEAKGQPMVGLGPLLERAPLNVIPIDTDHALRNETSTSEPATS